MHHLVATLSGWTNLVDITQIGGSRAHASVGYQGLGNHTFWRGSWAGAHVLINRDTRKVCTASFIKRIADLARGAGHGNAKARIIGNNITASATIATIADMRGSAGNISGKSGGARHSAGAG